MALISKIEFLPIDKNSTHSDVDCTYSLISNEKGQQLLQLDTYGASSRKLVGKKSQSIRFTSEALAQLKSIIAEHDL